MVSDGHAGWGQLADNAVELGGFGGAGFDKFKTVVEAFYVSDLSDEAESHARTRRLEHDTDRFVFLEFDGNVNGHAILTEFVSASAAGHAGGEDLHSEVDGHTRRTAHVWCRFIHRHIRYFRHFTHPIEAILASLEIDASEFKSLSLRL
jgi:hypothetical protein